jgi:hypothetical protein
VAKKLVGSKSFLLSYSGGMSEALHSALEYGTYTLGAASAISTSLSLVSLYNRGLGFKYPANIFDEQRIQQTRELADTATTYIHENHIGSIALIDTAARPFHIPLIHAWNQKYGDNADQKRPPIFFINPSGFRSQEHTMPAIEWAIAIQAFLKRRPVERPSQRRSAESILGSFATKYPGLYEQREKPALVIDSCLHTGNAVSHVIASMQAVGFQDVRLMVGYLDPRTKNLDCTPDVVLSKTQLIGKCYPFGIDTRVNKTYGSCNSVPTSNEKQRKTAYDLRKKLNNAMNKSDT